ncbi:MAG TPA: RHS repeat-associated core domain-containing protein [Bryobacteraceae bacterium]|nr:RHS repeat-associated core domain-containing protein [Bryobacteraceae bacterium]
MNGNANASTGNRYVSASTGPAPLQFTPQSNGVFSSNNRLASSFNTSNYDSSGNLQAIGVYSYTYDAESRQTGVNIGNPVNTTTTYSYDGEGRRVQKVTAAGSTIYVYDATGQLAAEYTSTPPAETGTVYLASDPLGSMRLVATAMGTVKSCHDYLPFGEEILQEEDGRGSCCPTSTGSTTDGVNQKFTGKERDAETASSAMQANDYFGARYYAPSEGRFTSPDWSALPQPVPYAKLTDPQTLNLYGYVRNNPLAMTDPDGHDGHQRCKGPDGNMVNCPSSPPRDKKTIAKGAAEVGVGIVIGAAGIATAPASGAAAGAGAALGLLGAVSSYGKGVIDVAKGMGKFED